MFIRSLLIGFTPFVFQPHRLAAQPAERPNIIFVLTDDQRYDALGAMGNSIIQTPNMDKLATVRTSPRKKA